MAHSRLFGLFRRMMQTALGAEREGVSTSEALERREADAAAVRSRVHRRDILLGAAGLAAISTMGIPKMSSAAPKSGAPRVAILGAGLSGLACADRLREVGIQAVIYEANDRVGGRCSSYRGFPGMVVENGGELIDTGHHMMRAYANAFKLPLETLTKEEGQSVYYFFGQVYTEADVVEEFRQLVERMRLDAMRISDNPTYFSHTADDEYFDRLSLDEYLMLRAEDLPLAREVIRQAYIAEYGLELDQQSSINFLNFVRMNKRSSFQPFGGSDERFHVKSGNDGITAGIASRLPGQIRLNARITRLRRLASGEYAVSIDGSLFEDIYDAIVCTIPPTVLRGITLDSSLGLSAAQLYAIQNVGYGNNAKTMVRFDQVLWADQFGANGEVYSDLPNVQNVWRTNPSAGPGAVLTDYSGGQRGFDLQAPAGSSCSSCHVGAPGLRVINPALIQTQVAAWLGDLETIFPGITAAASRDSSGNFVVKRAHWLPQRFSRGSYTCPKPGHFSDIEGLLSQKVGTFYFAGESANSFAMFQGFMEGAVLAGFDAASALLNDWKVGLL